MLVNNGADVEARNTDGMSTLHGAALGGDVPTVMHLIERDADVDARDSKDSTPLHAAAFLGRVRAVKALLDAGADSMAEDADGRAPVEMTRVDRASTVHVLGLLGLKLEQSILDAGRNAVAVLLR